MGCVSASDNITSDETNLEQQMDDNTKVNVDLNINKNKLVENNYKEESNPIILNSSNFDEYVTNGEFNEHVPDGVTVDLQGVFEGSKYQLNINKPVNIISSTNDGFIDYHTGTYRQYDEDNGGVFKISKEGAGTNITGITIHNTRLSVENTSNIHIDNVQCLDIDANIGMGVGSVTIREGSENISITNSYFKTIGNGGHSNVVFAAAYNCLFENNTIEAYGDHGLIGNCLYLTTYGVEYATPATNINITIRNNTIKSYNLGNIYTCWGLVLEGKGHLIENNYIDALNAVKSQYADEDYDFETVIDGIVFRNNYIKSSLPELVFPGVVYNNTFEDIVTLGYVKAFNNTFKDVNINDYTIFENNTANIIKVLGNSNVLTNNEIYSDNESYVIISGDNNTFDNNQVYSDNESDVLTISGTNNIVSNNKLASLKGRGEDVISNSSVFISINNSNETGRIYYITDLNAEKYFVYSTGTIDQFFNRSKIYDDDIFVFNTSKLFKPIDFGGKDIIIENSTSRIGSANSKSFTLKNSFITGNMVRNVTLINSTIIGVARTITPTSSDENSKVLGVIYPKDNTYLLSNDYGVPATNPNLIIINTTDGHLVSSVNDSANIYVLNYDANGYNFPRYYVNNIYIDKPVNLIGIPEMGHIDANLHLISGSEGSNITNVTFDGDLDIQTNNINIINCTLNNELTLNEVSFLNFENNIINNKINISRVSDLKFSNNIITFEEVPLNINSSNQIQIINNSIITNQTNTIFTTDSNCIIKNNELTTPTLLGDDTIFSNDIIDFEDNTPEYNTKIVVDTEEYYFKNDVFPVMISVINEYNNTNVTKGYVDVYYDSLFIERKELNGSSVIYEINFTELGKKPLDIFYYDGIKYANVFHVEILEVIKSNITITVDEFIAKLNENATTNITFTNQIGNPVQDTNVSVIIGRTTYTYETVDGIATLDETVTTEWFDSGRMTILFPDTDMYNRNTTIITLNTSKADAIITHSVEIEDNTVSINLTLTDVFDNNITDGRVIISTINGTQLSTSRITTGVFRANVTLPEDYNDEYIIANFTGSYYYNEQTVNISTITVKEETTITKVEVIPDPVVVGSQALINVTITTENESVINEGVIIVTDSEDNIIANASVTDNNAQLEFVSYIVGENTYIITYSNATHFNDTTAATTVTTRKIITNFELEYNISEEYDDEIEFVIKAFDELGNPTDEQINASINGRRVVRGVPYNGMLEGIYQMTTAADVITITVNYAGNSTHQQTTKDFQMIINKQDVTITLTPVEATINEEVTITATVTSIDENIINDGILTFTLDDGTIIGSSNVTDSTATITTSFTQTINTNITATYTQSERYNDNSNTTTIIIKEALQKTLKVDTTTFIIGQSTNITASIYEGDKVLTNITKGKIIFKVNGRTLKDDNGNAIYVKIVNGTATIENYTIPATWNKENLTIEAVYSGSNQYGSLRSDKQLITIGEPTPTITTEDITATKGETITLKATIKSGTEEINTGKVVFKINGKTVKDSNGKVIYLKVENGQVAINYTIPTTYKTKTYTITATYIATGIDRIEDTKTLNITNT